MEIIAKTGPQAEKYKEKLDQWLQSFPKWHENFVWMPNSQAAWCVPIKPLAESNIALISTGGIHLKNQPAFEVDAPFGDSSFRVIPSDTHPGDLTIAHTLRSF